MILITGASGTVGRAVLDALRKRKQPVKAMFRDAKDAKKGGRGVQTVVADFADKSSLKRAFSGVNTLFLVCSPIPQLVELEGNAIDVAKELGMKHVVLNSALGAADYPKSFPSWHRQVEDTLKSSGMPYTILRPNSFIQNIDTYNAPSIRAQGAFFLAMGNAKLSFIDVRDVGEAAAVVLVSPAAHAGKIYELNGPEALTYDQVAEKISRLTGQTVQFLNVPEDAQRKAMTELGMPKWQIDALLDLQQYYSVLGQGGEVTDVLPKLLGHAPRTLDQFLVESKESFRGQAASA